MRRALVAVLLLPLAPAPSRSGQVRIAVGQGGSSFSPGNYDVNVGDYVTWVWYASGHTVTSGNPAAPTSTGDGRFRSSTTSLGTGTTFTWRVVGAPGLITYYCLPHAPGMQGSLNVTSTPQPEADFRITEVEFAGAGGHDRVQIANLGSNSGFLGKFRFSWESGLVVVPSVDPISIGAGQRITLHINASGTNNSSNVYLPSLPDLGTEGSFAMFVPNNTSAAQGSSTPASLDDPTQMLDYVEWGTGAIAPPHQTTAIAGGFWFVGDLVNTGALPGGGTGYSIVFCGSRTERGASFWNIAHPNFGTAPVCTTPARGATWGRIKSLYR